MVTSPKELGKENIFDAKKDSNVICSFSVQSPVVENLKKRKEEVLEDMLDGCGVNGAALRVSWLLLLVMQCSSWSSVLLLEGLLVKLSSSTEEIAGLHLRQMLLKLLLLLQSLLLTTEQVPRLMKIIYIGQTTLGSAAIFGLFLGAGSWIHC